MSPAGRRVALDRLAEAELAEAVERIAVAWGTVAADGARPAAASPALVA